MSITVWITTTWSSWYTYETSVDAFVIGPCVGVDEPVPRPDSPSDDNSGDDVPPDKKSNADNASCEIRAYPCNYTLSVSII